MRERYLGIAGEEDIEKVTAEPIKRVTTGKREPKLLAVEDVTVRFGGLEALSGVSLRVEPGTTHAIIGPNGAGKSTLLNVLTGVYRASAGRVTYGDDDAHVAAPAADRRGWGSAARSRTSRCPRPRACVRTCCSAVTGSRGRASSPPACGCRARAASSPSKSASSTASPRCGAWPTVLDAPMGSLPYGVRKRAELARALCAEPTLLLLDEPVAGMNADESAEMARSIVQSREALGDLDRRSSSTTCRS